MKFLRPAAGLALAAVTVGVHGATPAAQPSPEDAVKAFYKAYDRHDVDALASGFDEGAALWMLGDEKPVFQGREGLRRLFLGRFRDHPKAKAKLADRMALGPWVVVRELPTLEPGEPAPAKLAIFEVAGGAISRIWVMEAGGEEGGIGGEGTVALQVEKWNEKDLPRLLTAYDPGAALFLLSTGQRLAAGEDALRERFEKIFDTSPRLHAEVLQRLSLGPWVAYRQRAVTGPDSEREDSIAIYEVRDGLIRRVWLLR